MLSTTANRGGMLETGVPLNELGSIPPFSLPLPTRLVNKADLGRLAILGKFGTG